MAVRWDAVHRSSMMQKRECEIDMSRRPKPLSTEQKALVSSVRRISKQRSRINASYIEAVVNAREAGITYAVIAEAAGMSSQAAQEIVRRHGSSGETSSMSPDKDDDNGSEDTEKSLDSVSGIQSGGPQGVAAFSQEVGTQNPGE